MGPSQRPLGARESAMATHMKARDPLHVSMAEFLKVWYSVDDMEVVGTLKWHRQPVLSVLRGVTGGCQCLEIKRETTRSYDRWRVSLEYRVSRGGVRIGTVNVEVGPRSVMVKAYSVHRAPEIYDGRDVDLANIKWDWNGRALGRSRSRDKKRIWKISPRPRPKFRRLGTRIRKMLLELDDMACVERVMES